MQPKIKQTISMLVLILVCLTGLFDKAYHLTPLPNFEQNAAHYLADVRERAAYSYAAARTLNATISLLESVDTGIGVVSLQPGQVLEPINDMIEQFSDVMLVALASVGLQEILVAILGDISWTYLLPLALLPLLLAPWITRYQVRLNRLGMVLLISVIATRLLIPTIAICGHIISENYLKPDYNHAIQHVESVRQQTSEAVGARSKNSLPIPPRISTPEDPSIFSKPSGDTSGNLIIPDWDTVKGLADSEKLLGMLNNVPDRIITLITIFIFETIAWPLLMALLFMWAGRLVLPPKD